MRLNKMLSTSLALFAVCLFVTPSYAQKFNPAQFDGNTVSSNCVKVSTVRGDNIQDAGGPCVVRVPGAPVPTGTGTPTIISTSTDTAGEVTAGSSATSVIITFAVAKTVAPFCVVRSQAQITSFAYTISTTAITITQTSTSGNLIDYVCIPAV